MMTEELRFKGQMGEIAALQFGNSKGIDVLALHGWLDNAASFLPLADHTNNINWISMDMAGHGHSDQRPRGCAYHFVDYIADVHQVVLQLGASPCNLVAHSMGAGVAAMFAAAFPRLVNKLVLIDGIGPLSGEDDDSLSQFRKSMDFLDKPQSQTPRLYDSMDVLIRKRMMAGAIERRSVECLLSRGSSEQDGKIVVHSDARLKQASALYMSQKKVLSILKGIECETLLVLADDGLVCTRTSTAQRIKAIKNIEVINVAGHHHVHMDSPQVMSEQIQNFLLR